MVSILRIRKGCGDYDIAVIRELLEFYLGRAGIGSYCLKNDGSCVTIAHVTDNKEGVMERIRKAYESLLEDKNAAILDSAALSCVEEGLDHLQETYRQARLVYENSTKVHRRVACYEDLKSLNTDVSFYSTQDINLLIKYFELRDYPKVDDIMERMFGLSENQMFSFQYIINVYYSLMIGIHSYFRQTNENPISDYMQMQDSIITDLKDCFTVGQVKEIIKNYVYEMLSDCTYVPVGSKKEILVNKIEQYLQEHYQEGTLSVNVIAENLFLKTVISAGFIRHRQAKQSCRDWRKSVSKRRGSFCVRKGYDVRKQPSSPDFLIPIISANGLSCSADVRPPNIRWQE